MRMHRIGIGVLFLSAMLAGVSTSNGQGIIVPTAGPINSAMAGASTAAPVDFGGSYWNPAILSGLDRQEALISSALAFPSIHLQSSIQAGAVGGLLPPTNRYGEARSDSGVVAGLATGFSFRLTDDSPLTLGLGIFGLVGGGVNFGGSYQVPILTPRRPPRFVGVGPIFANLSLLSINPIASLRLSDRLSIGAGPMITVGQPSFNPAFFAPGPTGPLGLPTFPAGTNARPYWGAGFQVGLLYELNDHWNFGFSYKSPIWQERWNFNATYPLGRAPRQIGVSASLPEILSWGVAYKGLPRTLIALDLRYIDYANTSLFGTSVINGGLGWQSVFAVALGTQYKATDRLTIRAGYLYNTNPIHQEATLFNVQAPGIITNTLSLGASYDLTEDVTFSMSWVHGFRNAIEGPVLQLPHSTVRLDAQVDTLWAGVNIKFGRPRKITPTPVASPAMEGAIVGDGADTFEIPLPSTTSPAAPSVTSGTLPPLPTDEIPSAVGPIGVESVAPAAG